MDKDTVKKISKNVLLILAGLTLAGYYFLKEKDNKAEPQPSPSSAAAAPVLSLNAAAPPKTSIVVSSTGAANIYSIQAEDGSVAAEFGAQGNQKITVNGSWNRIQKPIPLNSTAGESRPFDFGFGTYSDVLTNGKHLTYVYSNLSPSTLRMSADTVISNTSLSVVREIGLNGKGQVRETLVISNKSANEAVLDFNGVAFSFVSLYDFDGVPPVNVTKDGSAIKNSQNIVQQFWYDGKKMKKVDFKDVGVFGVKNTASFISDPSWVSINDNFFLSIMRPNFGRSVLLVNAFDAQRKKAGTGLQVLATNIPAGGVLQLGIDYYIGPNQEGMVAGIDKSYKKLFEWWPVFNLIMKPIETGTHWFIQKMFEIIPNAGIILILIALIVKLVLLPLSIKSAISMKKMRLIQPKVNKLQEKYGQDQALLQKKTMELYKEEKVNPMGGCLPLLLQMPVFFILFRVLSRSVELRGANFLWIKDLTAPDSLFMIGSFSFNLLPLIMTLLQLLTTVLQQGKMGGNESEMQKQMKTQSYLMPVIFLFLFWNMPSGLVLYWTAQNVFAIIEQEFINTGHAGEEKKAVLKQRVFSYIFFKIKTPRFLRGVLLGASMSFSKTIIAAPATAGGIAAVSMIRVSGENSLQVCSPLFQGSKPLSQLNANSTAHGKWVDSSGRLLDDVIVSIFRAPKSFTGEESVEITTHGSPYIVKEIMRSLIEIGVHAAEPGEFTQRAFLNGKLDLTAAEAVRDLIHAQSFYAHTQALGRLRGGLSEKINSLHKGILDLLALLEAAIDHSDEELDFAANETLQKKCILLIDQCTSLLGGARIGRLSTEGIKIALAGKPNTGKSSLLNALCQEDRVIVSDIAGTTRDVIEHRIQAEGLYLRLFDTAGIRESNDSLEMEGARRSRKMLDEADLVLWVRDGSKVLDNEDKEIEVLLKGKKYFAVNNKSDLSLALKDGIPLSAKTGEGLETLFTSIKAFYHEGGVDPENDILVANVRQESLLQKAKTELESALSCMKLGSSEEFSSAHIRRTRHFVEQITGKTTDEVILDRIFSQFCLGK